MRLKNTKTSSQVSVEFGYAKQAVAAYSGKTSSNQTKASLAPLHQKQTSIKGLSAAGMAEIIRLQKLATQLTSRDKNYKFG